MKGIRQERAEDYSKVKEVVSAAFGRDSEAILVEEIRKSDFFIPDLSLVAEVNDKVVGHILFTPVVIERAEVVVPALALAPLAVDPKYQGKGIGGKLIKEGLKICKELEYKIIIVLGHSQYYPKFGFVKAADYGIEPPFPVPLDAFMVLGLENGVLEGVPGVVRYPSVFDSV